MNATTEEYIVKNSAAVISNAIDFARNENVAIAVWRQPGEKDIQVIADFSENIAPTSDPLDLKAPGFVFAHYSNPASAFLIKADIHFSLADHQLATGAHYRSNAKAEAFREVLSAPRTVPETSRIINTRSDKQGYTDLVKKTIDAIRSGVIQKAVPSRKKEIEYDTPVDLGNNFLKLAEQYPAAFISLVYLPQTGVWMGATPELLISVKNKTFKTVSLAGTQKYDPEISLANVAWTQKEIEEQALVSRYIINCFKKIRLREYEEIGPKTVIAGNLLHLKTEFQVDMEATNFADLGEIMLKLLHPTSAICGMPLDAARAFLQAYENYDRQYFSGYLGPAHINGETTLYVNLRCMHIEEQRAILYAGAGVTEDSIPEKEWEETEIKMNTLLNIIS